jgi:two-component system phosphate regulon sensor histidine kinase PhoR
MGDRAAMITSLKDGLHSLVERLQAWLGEADAPARSRPRHPDDGHADDSAAVTWHGLMEAMPDPAIAVDQDRLVLHANGAALDLFGSLRRGWPISLASRAPELAEAIAQALTTQTPQKVVLHERMPVERRLDAAVAPIRTTRHDRPALLIVLQDHSERDRLAQMRADFIAHASHELRTPLASLRGFIETLQGPARDDAAARERFLGIMSAEAQRMTRILDDLLSLSRVEMRVHIPPTGRIEIGEVVAEVVESLEPIASAVATTIQVELPPGEHFVRGERDEIVQVLVNILQNAIKYGRQRGAVIVTMAEQDDGKQRHIEVAIADNGPGIPADHLPRLTERFYRVDDQSSREKGGTGLGLAIVKHILTRHQGYLKITSQLGHGSTFTVGLPVDDRE